MSALQVPHILKGASDRQKMSFSDSSALRLQHDAADATSRIYLVGKLNVYKYAYDVIHQFWGGFFFYICLKLCIGPAEQAHYGHLVFFALSEVRSLCRLYAQTAEVSFLMAQLLRTPRLGITFSPLTTLGS